MDMYFIEINRDLPLHNKIKRGILSGYPLKGGTYGRCDRRIIHRRGGSSEAEASYGYSQTTSANWTTNRIQDLEGMASQTVRPGQVYGRQDQQTAGVNISFSVAHPWPTVSQALSHGRCSRYLIAYYLTLPNTKQHKPTLGRQYDRQGVVGRDSL